MNLREAAWVWEKAIVAAPSVSPTCAAIIVVMFAGLLGIILVLIGWLDLLDAFWPGLGDNPLVEAAAISGLAVGEKLPRRDPRFHPIDDD